MPIIEFTAKDLLRTRILPPAWYRVLIERTAEKLSKNGDSTNWLLEGTIQFNADNGDKEFAGVPTPYWGFNSKVKDYFMPGFFAALGNPPDAKNGSRFELNNVVGKELDVFIENDTYEGRLVNRINHKYRQPQTMEIL